MKQRLLVMNGQRIIQSEVDGAWENEKVEKAGAIPPGIYNLHSAQRPVAGQQYDGVIVHASQQGVYQFVGSGKSLVQHDPKSFERAPPVGSVKSIKYTDDGVALYAQQAQARGRSL